MQLAVPVPADVEVEAAAVGRPGHGADLAVMVARDDPGAGAVPVHDVDLLIAIRVVVRVNARVGDERAVGRGDRAPVGAAAVGQLADLAAGDGDGVDLRLLPVLGTVEVLVAERREVDLASVRTPPDGRVVPVAVGELPGRAAAGRHHEDVRPAGVDVADAVALVRRALDHLGFAFPLGPVGSGGQIHPGEVGPVGDAARKRDPVPVRRPAGVGGPVFEACDLCGQSLRVHPAHVQLGTLRVARCGVENAGAVGRPGGAAAVDEVPVPRPVDVHDAQR